MAVVYWAVLRDCIHMVWILIKVFIIMVLAAYENHWMLSEKVAASGFDVGYSRTFKKCSMGSSSMRTHYNWRGREAA